VGQVASDMASNSNVISDPVASTQIQPCESQETQQEAFVKLDKPQKMDGSSSEASNSWVMNVKPLSTIASLDRHGKGSITESDLKFAIHRMRLMRKLVLFLALLVLVFIASTFCAMYVVIMLTKEMHVKNGHLTDNGGKVVSTIAMVDTIKGVQLVQSRRLSNASNASNTADASNPSNASPSNNEMLQISTTYVSSTIATYTDGKINWVVPLPDGTVRTVHIQGTSGYTTAWGRCESCEREYAWQVSCSEASATTCPITVRGLDQRRLKSSVDQQSEELDRALMTKSCE